MPAFTGELDRTYKIYEIIDPININSSETEKLFFKGTYQGSLSRAGGTILHKFGVDGETRSRVINDRLFRMEVMRAELVTAGGSRRRRQTRRRRRSSRRL